jgi:hypothetical protein
MDAVQDLNWNPKRWRWVHALVEELMTDANGNSTALSGDEEDSEEEGSLITPPSDPVVVLSDTKQD